MRRHPRKDTTMVTAKVLARYSRYLLATLATVAFGTNIN
jgi:hypothetical protein